MNGGPTKVRNNMPAWDIEKTRLQEARRKRRIFDVSSEETEDLKVITEARAKLERMRGSFNAVCFQRAMLGETRCHADFQMTGETRSSERQLKRRDR